MVTNEKITKIKDAIISAVDVEKLYLFGSYVYGTPNKDSDFDFYMVIPDNSGIRPIDASIKAQSALWGLKVGAVDILAGTTEIFNRRSQGVTLERKIATEGVLIYERRVHRHS
jgi:predicted nucleotidyltransferase